MLPMPTQDGPDACRRIAEIESYHAHVYFEAETRMVAKALYEKIADRFTVQRTQLFEEPVGPHPVPMFECAFTIDVYPTLVPWLMLNRVGLSVLIHPNTDRMLDDHTENPIWLGEKIALKTAGLPSSMRALGTRQREVIVNTQPTLAYAI
jgi:aromatic ring-cleaving dioxygenase